LSSRCVPVRFSSRHNGTKYKRTRIPELVGSAQALVVGAAVANISGADAGDGVGALVEDGSATDVAGGNSRSAAQTRGSNLIVEDRAYRTGDCVSHRTNRGCARECVQLKKRSSAPGKQQCRDKRTFNSQVDRTVARDEGVGDDTATADTLRVGAAEGASRGVLTRDSGEP